MNILKDGTKTGSENYVAFDGFVEGKNPLIIFLITFYFDNFETISEFIS